MEKTSLYSELNSEEQALVVATISSLKKTGVWRKIFELSNPKCTINIDEPGKKPYVRIEEEGSEVFELLVKNYI